MRNGNYRVVPYRREFRNQILEVQRYLWSSDPQVNSAYLQWKYERNPYLDERLIYVVLCEDEVVGMFGMHGTLWEIGESRKVLSVPSAGDGVVAPEHRKRGLFERLLHTAVRDLATRGYEYSFTLSAGIATAAALSKTGWRTAAVLRAISFKANEKIHPPNNDSFFCHLDDPGRGYRPRRDVRVERGARPEAMARLVARLEYDGRLRQVRDASYFAWRFQNPLCAYRFLYCGDTELGGYLVLGKPPFAGVSIVDWEASDFAARNELLCAAMDWGNFDRLTIWSATLSPNVRELLETRGFEPDLKIGPVINDLPVILLKDLREAMANEHWGFQNRSLTDPANWDVRMIYSDGY